MRPVRPRDLVRQAIDGVPVRVLQSGRGLRVRARAGARTSCGGSSAPDPQAFIAPMRDLLISLPPDTDRAFVAWLNDEFAEMDPNGLALDAFVLDGRDAPLRGAAIVHALP